MSHPFRLVAFFVVALLCAAPLAFAQTAAELEATATINAGLTPPPLPQKPLDIIKARAQQIKQNAQNAKGDLRTDVKMEFQHATTPGARLDVLKDAAKERVGITRDRIASTTALKTQIKAAVRIHAGLIKQRFQLALRHFDNLLTRIESRIEKLKTAGVATTSVETELSLAKAANATAEADVQAVADFIASVEDCHDRAAVRAELDAKVKKAQESIRLTHQALMKTVRALVTLARPNVELDASASTSASVESSE